VDCRCAVLLLLLIQLVSAAPLKLDGELHYNLLEVTLQDKEDYNISFELSLQLRKRAGEWELLDTIDCGGNFSLGALESIGLNCSYTTPEEPGEYKIYTRADIVNGSHTYKNFFFDVDANGFKEPEPESDVILSFISAPDSVKTGEEFSVVVNVTAYKDVSLEVYSYIHEGKACYSFYGWKGNAEKHDLKRGESRLINLTDAVAHKAVNGTYQLKVRARGEKDWDIVRAIVVEQVPPDLSAELPEKKSGQDFGWVLLLLALIPLLLLIVRNLL